MFRPIRTVIRHIYYESFKKRGPRPSNYRCFTIILVRTPQDEWSARWSSLYLTTHNTHKWHPCLLAGFEPPIRLSEPPQIYAVDSAATGLVPVNTAESKFSLLNIFSIFSIIPSEYQYVISRRSELLSLLADKAILVEKNEIRSTITLNINEQIHYIKLLKYYTNYCTYIKFTH